MKKLQCNKVHLFQIGNAMPMFLLQRQTEWQKLLHKKNRGTRKMLRF